MVSLCEELQKLSLSILSVYNLLQFEVAIVAQLQEGTVLQTHLEEFPYPAMCQFVGISATDNQGAHGDLIKQSFHSFCGARYLPSQDALGAALFPPALAPRPAKRDGEYFIRRHTSTEGGCPVVEVMKLKGKSTHLRRLSARTGREKASD